MAATPPDLASQLAALWGVPTEPLAIVPPTPTPKPTASAKTLQRLPPLPPPLRCELDHGEPTNWQLGQDPYEREGWRRTSCKGCGRFYGYQPPQLRRTKT